MASVRRSWVRALAGLVLLAPAACAGDRAPEAARAPATTEAPALTPPTLGSRPPSSGRSAARWETVSTLTGSGSTRTGPFQILPNAIQWRARYSCETGVLKAFTDPPPRRPAPLVEASCPVEGEGFSIVTGAVSVTIEAAGPWKLIIDQQVDTPLDEPPLPGMAAGRLLRQGGFYDIEMSSRGTARLFQLPDGRHALRMENFEVNENTDLFVWLDTAEAPRTSQAAFEAEHWVLGNLKSTLGNQNYEIPPNMPIERVRSIVIWCEPVAIAYGAAALSPA